MPTENENLTSKEREELSWLRYFIEHVDMGAATDDIIEMLYEEYKEANSNENQGTD